MKIKSTMKTYEYIPRKHDRTVEYYGWNVNFKACIISINFVRVVCIRLSDLKNTKNKNGAFEKMLAVVWNFLDNLL